MNTFIKLISKFHCLGVGNSLLDELVMEFLVNEEAGSSAAALSSVEEEAERSLLNGFINIGIIHDDVSRLTTELESDSLQVVDVGLTHNFVSDFGRSSEGNLVNILVLGKLGTDITLSGEDVNNTSGESSFVDQFSNSKSTEGSLLSGLDDSGASSSESWSNFPCHHEGGEVPGDNLGGNTNSFLSGELEVGSMDRSNFSHELISPGSVLSDLTLNEVDISSMSDGGMLTVIESLKRSKLFSVLSNEVS